MNAFSQRTSITDSTAWLWFLLSSFFFLFSYHMFCSKACSPLNCVLGCLPHCYDSNIENNPRSSLLLNLFSNVVIGNRVGVESKGRGNWLIWHKPPFLPSQLAAWGGIWGWDLDTALSPMQIPAAGTVTGPCLSKPPLPPMQAVSIKFCNVRASLEAEAFMLSCMLLRCCFQSF